MKHPAKPRILYITPEVTYLPHDMGEYAQELSAKAGGLADVSAALVSALHAQGSDIHIAIPDYRALFNFPPDKKFKSSKRIGDSRLSLERIHLAEDCSFYYLNNIYAPPVGKNKITSLAFQREIINHILPKVKPDLIHCNDWMTGLIPSMARALNIPCLFTIHNTHSVKTTLAEIEDRGIDGQPLWPHLFFERFPSDYQESRFSNQLELLTSGVFAAHFVNTVSKTFLTEIIQGRHEILPPGLRQELTNKMEHGCAAGILNAPDPSFNPVRDKFLKAQYSPSGNTRGKKINKRFLQEKLHLKTNSKAAVFFWPSRLDNGQKGCNLLLEIIPELVSTHGPESLQIVFIADGEYCQQFKGMVHQMHLEDQVSIRPFDDPLQRLAYGAADFILMPSAFEPCGLPQMIGAIYGALPVVHDTGGLHDTVSHLDLSSNTGNGFVFKHHNAEGFRWALDQAMAFHALPETVKSHQRQRIMTQSLETFTHMTTARKYVSLYEAMLKRPLL